MDEQLQNQTFAKATVFESGYLIGFKQLEVRQVRFHNVPLAGGHKYEAATFVERGKRKQRTVKVNQLVVINGWGHPKLEVSVPRQLGQAVVETAKFPFASKEWDALLDDYLAELGPDVHIIIDGRGRSFVPPQNGSTLYRKNLPVINDCDIHAIAKKLNTHCGDYAIGGLQELRKTIKNLSRRPCKGIFSGQTTRDDWAFHHGGRTELQFNIGKDGSGGSMLRHGIAFSFETSQTLPTIDPLTPKVRLFNDFLQLYPDKYADMRMWHFDRGNRSDEYMPSSIPPERVKENVFVFLGKRKPIEQLDYHRILDDFDRLLPLYRYVESGGSSQPTTIINDIAFSFTPGCTIKLDQTTAHHTQGPIDVALRHNDMQEMLYNTLVSKYGEENVGTELPSGVGTSVDVVVQHSDSFWFYEIKTAHSPRACIRQAIGQLLEYSYWPTAQEAAKLIVVGEMPLDSEGEAYLSLLNNRFSLSIAYEHVVLPRGDNTI